VTELRPQHLAVLQGVITRVMTTAEILILPESATGLVLRREPVKENLALITIPDLQELNPVKITVETALKEWRELLQSESHRHKDLTNHKPLLNNKLIEESVESVETTECVKAALSVWSVRCKELKLRHHNPDKNNHSQGRNSRSARKADRLHSRKCKDLNVHSKVHLLQEVMKAEAEEKDPKDQDPAAAEEVNQPG